jgi:hypothetical protein
MFKNTYLKTEWRDEILELLNTRPVNIKYEDIAKVTKLHKNWLSMFARGRITHPSVNAMNTLHDYLVEQMNGKNDKSI